VVADIANVFGVSPLALTIPDIDSNLGLVHTFFALEDIYGLSINNIDGELCMTLDKSKGTAYTPMFDMFSAWQREAEKLEAGEITKEEYNDWRYNYPKAKAERTRAAIDSLREEKNAEPTE
jgi:hypothetical protein